MKRSQIKRRPLADSVLKTLEPEARVYRELDGNGVYFEVKPSGTKSWVLRYKRPDGRWAWKGLGGFPAVSGRVARKRAQELLDLAADGHDLKLYTIEGDVVQKVVQQDDPLVFRDIGEQWYERKEISGRSSETMTQYRTYLDKDIYPVIGDKPLETITRADCAKIQSEIEKRGSLVIAGKVRRWLRQIFSQAIALGQCENNPASELNRIAQEGHEEKQYPHLMEDELPAFLKALDKSKSTRRTLIMVWLVLRTACRPGMARWAEWSEFDLKKGLWTVPADKMKMNRDHIIPLARQTVADLEELYESTGQGQYLFPGQGPNNIVASENTVNRALSLVGYKGKLVGHGARHTASTLLNEHNWEHRVVEAQLAHKLKGVAGVYNKAKYLEQRKLMMQWYADYLDWLHTGGKKPKDPVIQLPE